MTTPRLVWVCPECAAEFIGMAQTLAAAETALLDGIREHVATHGEPAPNPAAQTSWVAAAGHLVELYGGPFDGDRLWCPPGELPDVVGVHRTTDGAAVPIRSATARLLPHVSTYRLGDLVAAQARGRAPRYLYDGRPR